jgi:hypothetical protein
MKGSNGKKKRSKQAFALKQLTKRNKLLDNILEKRQLKHQLKNEARERERKN